MAYVNKSFIEDLYQSGNSTLPDNFDDLFASNDRFQYYSDLDELLSLSSPSSILASTDGLERPLDAELPYQAASTTPDHQGQQACVAWSDITYSDRPFQSLATIPQACHWDTDMLSTPTVFMYSLAKSQYPGTDVVGIRKFSNFQYYHSVDRYDHGIICCTMLPSKT